MQQLVEAVRAEPIDEARDLSPAAKLDDVSAVAAEIGARGGLGPGMDAIDCNQSDGVIGRAAIDQEGLFVHHRVPSGRRMRNAFPNRSGVAKAQTGYGERGVSHAALDRGGDSCHGAAMPNDTPSSTMAGGVFLALGTIGGVMIGSINGQPSIGFLIGLGVGALLAGAVWWQDR